ncbi:MAG: hypothetical protein WCH86_00120 [Kiritimatiellales bacterium]
MIRSWKEMPKYFRGLVVALLLVVIVQYVLMTGLVRPVGGVFLALQIFCYLLLAAALLRGFIERSRLAWLVAQIMLTALFDFSLLFAAISAVFSLKTDSLWIMVGSAVATTVLNGLLMVLLFVIPVRNYFRPLD